MLKHNYIYIFINVLSIVLLASCNDNDYTTALPRNSIAIIESPAHALGIDIKGIDTQKNTYFFEMADGMLGLCSPVNDESEVDKYLHLQNTENNFDNFAENNGIPFCTMNGKWVIGYNNAAMLIMGPVIPSERSKTVRRILQLLNQEEERSVKNAEIWKHLNEHTSENTSVAKMAITVSALPEQLMAAFSLGAPRGTTPEEIILEGNITTNGNTMSLNGHMCSYNTNTKQQLQQTQQNIYHPLALSSECVKALSDSALICICMNIKGEEFMPHLHNNKQLNTLLLGTEAYDKLKQVNGDVAIFINAYNESGETKYKVDVKDFSDDGQNLTDANKSERLIVTLNTEALKDKIGSTVIPLPENINKIIYSLSK